MIESDRTVIARIETDKQGCSVEYLIRMSFLYEGTKKDSSLV
jgi:hypothetical protein